MKNRLIISFLGIAAVLASVLSLPGEDMGPDALIAKARAVVLTPHFSRDEITKALVNVLDASLLILPKTDQSGATRSRIESVRGIMQKGEIFTEKAREDLSAAYKTMAGGKAWKVPEEISSESEANKGIEQATKICVRLLDSGLAAYKAGRGEDAVRDLLGMVILVVTPIERSR